MIAFKEMVRTPTNDFQAFAFVSLSVVSEAITPAGLLQYIKPAVTQQPFLLAWVDN